MRTRHIYSSLKIALILFLRNKIKSHMKFHFWLSLAQIHVHRMW